MAVPLGIPVPLVSPAGKSGVTTNAQYPEVVVTFDTGDMRVKEMQHLRHAFHGLRMNFTDMDAGRAMFSSAGDGKYAGFEPVEGMVGEAQPYRGLQMGNLSFTVPGLEGKADVKGNWMTVSHSREGGDDEVARNFRKFHDKLQRENEKKDMQKEPADMVEVIMQGL